MLVKGHRFNINISRHSFFIFFPGKVPHLKVNKSQCETDISFFISCLKGLFPLIWQDTPKLGLITFLSYLLRRGFLVSTLFHCVWSSSLAYYLQQLLPPCTVMHKTLLSPGGSVLIGWCSSFKATRADRNRVWERPWIFSFSSGLIIQQYYSRPLLIPNKLIQFSVTS